ncbi:MAG: response regulator [Kiritimatiellia bacterium]
MNDPVRILVVDGDPVILEATARLVEELGLAVNRASSGEEALQAVQRCRPDLLLLDRDMPGIDGLRVCRRIKGDPALAEIFVVIVSGSHIGSDEQADGLESGADGYITRPVSDRELIARVDSYVRILRLTRSLRRYADEVKNSHEVVHQSRLASLNVMEDAVADRDRAEQARQALQESEARYRNLIEYAPVAIFVDRDDRVVLANDACARLFGASSPGQLIGKAPFELIHPDFHAMRRERIPQLLDSGKPIQPIEQKIVRLDGVSVDVEASAAPFQDQGGTAVHVVLLFDITERKRAEAYREMGREILQILNEPGELGDSIQRILTVLKTRTGFDAAGIRLQQGEDFPYFVHNGFPHDFLLTENTLVERGPAGDVCRTKEGKISLACTCGLVISGKTDPANPFFTPGGSFWTNDSFPLLELPPDKNLRHRPRNECIHKGYASVALVPIRTHDRIVGLVQLNDRRKGCLTRAMLEILEGIAAHIGSALMRRRAEEEKVKLETHLQQAQKMESVGRLAGGVAHDFNNILQAIIGNVEMALEDIPPGSPGRESLEEIRKCADRSAHLTRQLLAFARKQTISPKVLDLNEIVAGMLKMIRRLIGEQIEISWQPQPDLWPIMADPSQIDQILANLCVNAGDAIVGSGKVIIEMGNRTIDKAYCADHAGNSPGDYVRLAVIDTGSGMDPDTLQHIFEPFFTSKGVGRGTGLGLATVYGIVKQNEGFINVSSTPGQGTCFELFLPRTLSEATPALVREIEACPGGNETILLAEDEEPIRDIASRILEKLGYTVLPAESPVEALRLAEGHSGTIHLLLTDVIMPGMNGRQLSERIRAARPNIRCLFMSGYPSNIIALQGVLDEGVNFLQKPFSYDELARKVREVLDEELSDDRNHKQQCL